MADSSFGTFFKSFLFPLVVAASTYIILFHVLVPAYRRYRARYSQYMPVHLQSSRSRWTPRALEGLRLGERISNAIPVPSLRNIRSPFTDRGMFTRAGSRPPNSNVDDGHGRDVGNRNAVHNSRNSRETDTTDDDDALFDAESGEAMVGFDMQNTTTPNQSAQTTQQLSRYATTAPSSTRPNPRTPSSRERTEIDSSNRLSRELEEVFRDDTSDSEDDEAQESRVTTGRRSFSASR